MHRFFACLALSAALSFSLAQASPQDTLIAGADLQADVDLLARAYETLHPGL